MREILFRGKRKDNGEWTIGYYFAMHHNDARTHIHHFIIPLDCDLSKDTPIEKIQVEVIPETVGQFTGLIDGNGRKIFEGDIVIIDTKNISFKCDGYFVVKYNEDSARFVCNGYGLTVDFDNVYSNSEVAVEGNIYDNKKLSEVINNVK